jgi:hypothetical protein
MGYEIGEMNRVACKQAPISSPTFLLPTVGAEPCTLLQIHDRTGSDLMRVPSSLKWDHVALVLSRSENLCSRSYDRPYQISPIEEYIGIWNEFVSKSR